MKKLYIFCVPSIQNLRILKSLYMLLAAGCKLEKLDNNNYAIRPVIIGEPKGDEINMINDLEKCRQQYEKVRNWRYLSEEARDNIFSTRIIEAYCLTNIKNEDSDSSISFIHYLFQNDNSTYSKGLEWEHLFRSNNPNVHIRITSQDSVLCLLQSEDPQQTVLAKLLFDKKWIKKVEHTGILVDYSQRKSDENEQLTGYGLSLVQGVEKTIVVPHTGRVCFGAVVAASAILDFMSVDCKSGSVVFPHGIRSDDFCYYNSDDLPYYGVRNHLAKFHLFCNIITGKYLTMMSDWKKRIDYDYNVEKDQFLSNNEIIPFVKLFRDWMSSMSEEFRFVQNDSIDKLMFFGNLTISISDVIHKLNKVEKSNHQLTNAEQKQHIVNSLIDSAYHIEHSESEPVTYYEDHSFKSQDYKSLILYEWRHLPNPFALFLNYKWAFEYRDNPLFLQQRSYCLDMWELFFRYGKNELNAYFDIEEVFLNDNCEGHYWDVLNGYNEYNQLYGDKLAVCYFIKLKRDKRVIAYSSTYTGFCVRYDETEQIRINNKVFFSPNKNDWKELNEREKDFQVFMLRYLILENSFSSSFIQYVNTSLSPENHVLATTIPFLDAYKKYQYHIPVK